MRCKGISDGRGIYGVRIYGIDEDAVNVPRFFETHQLPGFSGVHAFEDTLAQVERIPWIAFARSYPYNIWIRLLDGHRTDVLCRLIVEYRGPGITAVLCFPNTARSRSEVDDVRIVHHHIQGSDAATHTCRTNVTGL